MSAPSLSRLSITDDGVKYTLGFAGRYFQSLSDVDRRDRFGIHVIGLELGAKSVAQHRIKKISSQPLGVGILSHISLYFIFPNKIRGNFIIF